MPNDGRHAFERAILNQLEVPVPMQLGLAGDCLTTTTFISFTPPIFELVALMLLLFVARA